MTPLLITADVHFSEDTPQEMAYGLKFLRDCAFLARQHGTTHVIVAGDFFNYKLKLSPRLLLAVFDQLLQLRRDGVLFTILRGNHDTLDDKDPEVSPLTLLSSVAAIVTKTEIVEEKDYVLALVPWYPPEQFRAEVQSAAERTLGFPGKRILISHISIQEGKVSPSNKRVGVPIRTADLMPGSWDRIYLGDYHACQELPGKCGWFVGAPYPHTFGDFDCLGVWKVGLEATVWREEILQLPSRYPKYCSWRVDRETDLPLRGYDARNHNRCYCKPELIHKVATSYPTCKLINSETVETGAMLPRFKEDEGLTTFQIADRWRTGKGFPEEPYTTEIKLALGVV